MLASSSIQSSKFKIHSSSASLSGLCVFAVRSFLFRPSTFRHLDFQTAKRLLTSAFQFFSFYPSPPPRLPSCICLQNLYFSFMNKHLHITSDPRVMTGMPCIKGTRITVANIVRQFAAGRTTEAICADYPYLTIESIKDAMSFAADLTCGESYELLAS